MYNILNMVAHMLTNGVAINSHFPHRYAFPLLYALFFLLIVWIKVWSNSELDDGPSPQKSALGLQN